MWYGEQDAVEYKLKRRIRPSFFKIQGRLFRSERSWGEPRTANWPQKLRISCYCVSIRSNFCCCRRRSYSLFSHHFKVNCRRDTRHKRRWCRRSRSFLHFVRNELSHHWSHVKTTDKTIEKKKKIPNRRAALISHLMLLVTNSLCLLYSCPRLGMCMWD